MPLSHTSPISGFVRITAVQKLALKKLGIHSIIDLLYHFPSRYGDTAEAKNTNSLEKGDNCVIYGKISDLRTMKGFRSKIPMAEAFVEDETGRIQCVWFNQPYLAKMYLEDTYVRIEGKISERRNGGSLYFSNPKIEKVTKMPIGVGDSLFQDGSENHTLYPVYPESRGITTLWIYHTILKIYKSGILDNIPDPLPEYILKKYNLPSLKTALIWVHTPLSREDALSARKRFSFEEIFTIQVQKKLMRLRTEQNPAFVVENDRSANEFVKRLPFKPTEAQTKAVEAIINDMKSGKAMSRLLEGDVGSGKTAVAAASAYTVITSKPKDQDFGTLQVAYMCPTEILASQHFESFIRFFSYLGVQIGFISSSGCRKFPSKVNPRGWTDISRNQLLKWVQNGEISVLIGTHSLIQKSVKFKHLALVIIDEQHRFGTSQRASLTQKNSDQTNNIGSVMPHLLSMTATPIPRTLSLTMYGDLDLTLLDQSPEGRKTIITELVLPNRRDGVYEKVREEINNGRQVYVICPRTDSPDPDKEDALNAKSVKEEAKRLKEKVFPEFEINILHSKMSPKEKEKVMMDFKDGKIHILCATSVVEVGVNVPNATVILIEGAERFGLSQLHQLRGRVQRSSHQSYCYVFTETNSEKSLQRLKALQSAKNGFELAEIDLAQRGAGQLRGGKQWGVSDLAMEALQNLKMVEAARTESEELIKKDSDLKEYPYLKSIVDKSGLESHFE